MTITRNSIIWSCKGRQGYPTAVAGAQLRGVLTLTSRAPRTASGYTNPAAALFARAAAQRCMIEQARVLGVPVTTL